MRYPRNPSNLSKARSLRRNMTPQERHLWYDFLRFCSPRFRRQELLGSYVVDFFCYEAKLVVEIDGSQHFSPETIAYDAARTAFFHSLGIRVLRVDNGQVNRNFSSVCERILLELQQCGIDATLDLDS